MRRVCWWAGLEPAQSGSRVPRPPRRAPPALGRPASCRTRPSAVSERRRHRLTPGRGLTAWWTLGISEARPPACRAGALPLSEVSVVVMGGFDPPPRAFQARALPTELHDRGAGPGTRTRIDWVTKPVPIPLGPAGTGRAAVITPRHPGAVLHRRRRRAGRARAHPASSRPRMHLPRNRSQQTVCLPDRRASSGRRRMEEPPFCSFGRKVSNPHLKDQNLASCHWTTPEWVVVGGVNGYRPHYSWVEATRVSVNTLTPKSSRRVLTPRPPRWQRDALPLSYYCDGGTGWSLTSVARVAIGYLNPRPRCQGCGGGHRTPDDGG